jgi:hypothetical protein
MLRYGLVLAGLGGGLLVFILQAVRWFQSEMWTPVSVLTALQWLRVRWVFAPKDAYGVRELLDAVPLAMALAVAGVLAALALRSRD